MANLRNSILRIGQKVKLDPVVNSSLRNKSVLRKHLKVVGFWYKGKIRKTDPTCNNPYYRDFSGILVQDKNGFKFSVNRFQLKSIKNRKV